MFIRRLSTVLLIAGLLCANGFGQALSPEERAKKIKDQNDQIVAMLDRTIAEAAGLRLAQNRVVIGALAADVYWRYDPKRSRDLFRQAANDLTAYQLEMEKERLDAVGQQNMEIFDPTDPRYEFLSLVGMRDADLAIELMTATRTAAIADAMARIAQDAAMGGPGLIAGAMAVNSTNAADRARAQQEIALEQTLTMRAASGDPEKLVKAIKDSLAKGISPTVTTLLQQLMQKDEKRANDLAGEMIAKITGSDLSRSSGDLNGAISILTMMNRPPPAIPATLPPGATRPRFMTYTPEQTREVGLKLATTFLQPGAPAFVNSSLPRIMPVLEKVVPERAALLKARDAQNKKAAAPPAGSRPQAAPRTWNPTDTPEAIIAAAGKITNANERISALNAAANQIPTITDEARAKRIIDSIPDERVRSQAQERFDNARISKLTIEGRLEDARAAIVGTGSRRAQIQRLVRLAIQFHRKNTEKDIETAAGLMNEAKSLANTFPEDEDELGDYMELIQGYAVIEPDTAFRMIEPLMDQFNEMVQASAVLSRYNKRDRAFKKGELIMRINGGAGNGMLAFRFLPQIQTLAGADLDRMSTLVDRFQRNDARTLMKLYVLQGSQRYAQAPPPPRPVAQ